MGYYADWTPEALLAEIAAFRAALRENMLGGEPTQVWGEGRKMVVSAVNAPAVRTELANIEAELARRPGYENRRAWAIPVEIG